MNSSGDIVENLEHIVLSARSGQAPDAEVRLALNET